MERGPDQATKLAPCLIRSRGPCAALRRDEDFDLERKVTWLELFFDLVFVVVLACLSDDLAHHVDVDGVIDFVILFACRVLGVERVHVLHRAFRVRRTGEPVLRLRSHGKRGGVGRLDLRWSQGALHRIRGRLHRHPDGEHGPVDARAAAHVPTFRPVAYRFFAGFAAAAALIIVAIGLDGENRRQVFAAAVLVDIATPAFTLRQQAALPQLSILS